MASAFEYASSSGNQMDLQRQQFPFKRVELTINKFIKILQIDLDRLHRHKVNIIRLQAIQDWKALDKEQVNAYRTVQQIKGTIRQLEQTRTQVLTEDLHKFDSRLRDIHEKAVVSVQEFLSTQVPASKNEEENPQPIDMYSSFHSNLHPEITRADWASSRGMSESFVEPAIQLKELQESQEQLVMHPENIPDAQAEKSWNNLKESLDDLNGLMSDFSTIVHAQKETVDRIEDNVDTSQANVRSGVGSLAQAAKYKSGIFPIAGALIGGALGGPVGMFAGLKLGGLAAVGGGLVGFTSGRFVKKKTDESTDQEMQNLSKLDSRSLPDLASNEKR